MTGRRARRRRLELANWRNPADRNLRAAVRRLAGDVIVEGWTRRGRRTFRRHYGPDWRYPGGQP